MKNLPILLLGILALLVVSCANSVTTPGATAATLAITSKADTTLAPSSAGGLMHSYVSNGPADITAYRVTFYKIEIGNAETNKFTVWSNASGELKDIAGATISFSNVVPADAGTYKFMRLTIDTNLVLSGNVTLSNGTVTNVTATNRLGTNQFLWGTSDTGATGGFLLTSAVNITNGGKLAFVFKVKNTVWVTNDVVGTRAPEITVTAQ